jgi:hypothetical protein
VADALDQVWPNIRHSLAPMQPGVAR